MSQIWKFPLDLVDEQIVNIPSGAHILCVQVNNNKICLYAGVIPDSAVAPKKIIIVRTDYDLPDHMKISSYIGTVELYDGAMVLHVFEG